MENGCRKGNLIYVLNIQSVPSTTDQHGARSRGSKWLVFSGSRLRTILHMLPKPHG